MSDPRGRPPPMRQVTKVRPKGRQQRWTVFLDGEAWVVVDAEIRTKFSVHEGESLEPGTCHRIEEEAERLAALDRATRMLAARGRSAKELERKLKERGIGVEKAQETVERLSRTGLVDDARHAVHYARQKAFSGHGRRRIELELARQGVDGSLTRSALDEAFADEGVDAEGRLWSVAQRRWQGMSRLEPMARRRRLTSFLARRGHEMGDIQRIVERLEREERER